MPKFKLIYLAKTVRFLYLYLNLVKIDFKILLKKIYFYKLQKFYYSHKLDEPHVASGYIVLDITGLFGQICLLA